MHKAIWHLKFLLSIHKKAHVCSLPRRSGSARPALHRYHIEMVVRPSFSSFLWPSVEGHPRCFLLLLFHRAIRTMEVPRGLLFLIDFFFLPPPTLKTETIHGYPLLRRMIHRCFLSVPHRHQLRKAPTLFAAADSATSSAEGDCCFVAERRFLQYLEHRKFAGIRTTMLQRRRKTKRRRNHDFCCFCPPSSMRTWRKFHGRWVREVLAIVVHGRPVCGSWPIARRRSEGPTTDYAGGPLICKNLEKLGFRWKSPRINSSKLIRGLERGKDFTSKASKSRTVENNGKIPVNFSILS